jgi:hypothetical protein
MIHHSYVYIMNLSHLHQSWLSLEGRVDLDLIELQNFKQGR